MIKQKVKQKSKKAGIFPAKHPTKAKTVKQKMIKCYCGHTITCDCGPEKL